MPDKIRRHTIVFSNQKGGVGKTTDTREIGIAIADTGKRTLVIDSDPQANLSRSLSDDIDYGLYEALTGEDYEVREIFPNLFLLAGSIKLASLEKNLIGEVDAYTRLKELLQQETFSEFEYILIDTPPSLGVLTLNALAAAKHLIIPMNPSLYSMQGTNDLLDTVAKVRKNLNPDLSLLGVIINAFDKIPVITREIRQEIEETFKDKVFKTAISKSIKIEEAIANRHGVTEFAKTKAKNEIKEISGELVRRLEFFQAAIMEAAE